MQSIGSSTVKLKFEHQREGVISLPDGELEHHYACREERTREIDPSECE